MKRWRYSALLSLTLVSAGSPALANRPGREPIPGPHPPAPVVDTRRVAVQAAAAPAPLRPSYRDFLRAERAFRDSLAHGSDETVAKHFVSLFSSPSEALTAARVRLAYVEQRHDKYDPVLQWPHTKDEFRRDVDSASYFADLVEKEAASREDPRTVDTPKYSSAELRSIERAFQHSRPDNGDIRTHAKQFVSMFREPSDALPAAHTFVTGTQANYDFEMKSLVGSNRAARSWLPALKRAREFEDFVAEEIAFRRDPRNQPEGWEPPKRGSRTRMDRLLGRNWVYPIDLSATKR